MHYRHPSLDNSYDLQEMAKVSQPIDKMRVSSQKKLTLTAQNNQNIQNYANNFAK